MRHGKRIIDHGRYQLDFRNKKVRDFATSIIDRVVGEYGVGYIKMDYNIEAGKGTEVNDWMCLGFKNKDCTRLAVWRMDSEKNNQTIPLDFKVTSVQKLYPLNSDYNLKKDIDGIKVMLPEKFCAVLIEVK